MSTFIWYTAQKNDHILVELCVNDLIEASNQFVNVLCHNGRCESLTWNFLTCKGCLLMRVLRAPDNIPHCLLEIVHFRNRPLMLINAPLGEVIAKEKRIAAMHVRGLPTPASCNCGQARRHCFHRGQTPTFSM